MWPAVKMTTCPTSISLTSEKRGLERSLSQVFLTAFHAVSTSASRWGLAPACYSVMCMYCINVPVPPDRAKILLLLSSSSFLMDSKLNICSQGKMWHQLSSGETGVVVVVVVNQWQKKTCKLRLFYLTSLLIE